ncbi:UNVERIFIED_CONTAM: hypothetical protein GTU68_002399 [Idotea baltica]|nr:hypothetical protein [Idotea baltica]
MAHRQSPHPVPDRNRALADPERSGDRAYVGTPRCCRDPCPSAVHA